MSVPSLPFLGFALLGALIYQLAPARGSWRPILLLILNLTFFATFVHRWTEALPYAAFLLLGWVGVFAAPRGRAAFWFFALAVFVRFLLAEEIHICAEGSLSAVLLHDGRPILRFL